MNAPTLLWLPEVPADIRQSFEPHLMRWLSYVPRWCHELLIGWSADASDADLLTQTYYEYRWAKIIIHASFLNRTYPERSNEALHEILHVATGPYAVATGDLVDFMKEKHPDLYPWALEVRRAGMEATVTDLAEAIMRSRGTVDA